MMPQRAAATQFPGIDYRMLSPQAALGNCTHRDAVLKKRQWKMLQQAVVMLVHAEFEKFNPCFLAYLDASC